MQEREHLEIQKEIHGGGGKLAKYQDLILGNRSLWALLKYECITGIAGDWPGAAGLWLRSKLYPMLLGRSGRGVTFGRGVVLRHPRKIRIGDRVIIDDGCVLDAKGKTNLGIDIGNGVFLGRGTILNCKNGDIVLEENANIGFHCTVFSASRVVIGRDMLIAAYCYLVGGDHRFDNPAVPVLHQGRTSRGIHVGSGGWLGAHITVFDGVRIGKHAVIGAGSVVNHDIPDGAVAAGVPAKVLKERPVPESVPHDPGRKRLLYLSMYDPHVPYTGCGVRGGEFVNFLARDFEVNLVYLAGSGHPSNPDLEKKFADRLQGVGRKIRIPFSPLGYFVFSRPLFKAAANILSSGTTDLLFADYGLAARYALRLSKQFHIPFVYSSANIEYRQYLGKAKSDPRRWPLVPYMYWFEKRAVQKADFVVAVSDDDAEHYARWTIRDKICVVPQGFDGRVLHPHYPPPSNDPKIVLFFGNFHISTNREAVRVLRESIVDRVTERYPNVRFQIVGANPPLEFSHPRFEFTGFVDSVIPYLRGADVVVSPMVRGWGMSTKVVESLACGKWVIATDIAARSMPRHYRRLTVCGIERFPEAIIKALEEGNPVDAGDFEALKKDFLWENRLAIMRDRIRLKLNL